MVYFLKNEVDWKEIFVKYVEIVEDCAGVTYLCNRDWTSEDNRDWTSEEWEAIQEALNEQR